MNKKLLTTSLLTALTSTHAMASDEAIDPSDLTRVYTQAAFFVTSDADVRVSTMMTGSWSENIQFGGFAEANFGDTSADNNGDNFGFNYKNARIQYYQVSPLNNTLMPRVGFMVDAMHNDAIDMQVLSVGAMTMVNPKYTGNAMVFPNVNYTYGEILDETVDGYLLNLFATVPIGDSGSFIQIWPEYMDVSGDSVEMTSQLLNVMFSAPVKSNRSQWLMAKLEYGSSELTKGNSTLISGDSQLKAEIGMKWFF
jgi:hypothetical protein